MGEVMTLQPMITELQTSGVVQCLPLSQKIHLAAAAQSLLSRGKGFRSRLRIGEPLAPSDEYAEFALASLYEKGLLKSEKGLGTGRALRLSPVSSASTACQWSLELSSDSASGLVARLTEAVFYSEKSPDQVGELTEMWCDLSLAEVQSHLMIRFDELNFDRKLVSAAMEPFVGVVRAYSIAQLCYLGWIVGRDLAELCRKAPEMASGVLGRQIAELVASRIERARGWSTIKPFHRDARLPQSTIVSLYAEHAVRIGDDYWHVPPSEDVIAAIQP